MVDPQEFLNDGWKEDVMLPSGFFYPAAQHPHLHVTNILRQGHAEAPYILAYLGYTDENSHKIIIYKKDNIDNPELINDLPAAMQEKARFAYGKK